MKTAKENAACWLNDNVAGWTDMQLKTLTLLLKEQDRDTRHACAENVVKYKEPGCSPYDGSNMIRMEYAHCAIMNTKAL